MLKTIGGLDSLRYEKNAIILWTHFKRSDNDTRKTIGGIQFNTQKTLNLLLCLNALFRTGFCTQVAERYIT